MNPGDSTPGAPGAAPRVAIVSYAFDILERVGGVGPGIAAGVASTVLSTALNGLPGDTQATLAQGLGALADQLKAEGPDTIEQARAVAGQLAAVDPAVSQALMAAASALSSAASPAISPFDQTAAQLARVLDSLAEPPVSPSP